MFASPNLSPEFSSEADARTLKRQADIVQTSNIVRCCGTNVRNLYFESRRVLDYFGLLLLACSYRKVDKIHLLYILDDYRSRHSTVGHWAHSCGTRGAPAWGAAKRIGSRSAASCALTAAFISLGHAKTSLVLNGQELIMHTPAAVCTKSSLG